MLGVGRKDQTERRGFDIFEIAHLLAGGGVVEVVEVGGPAWPVPGVAAHQGLFAVAAEGDGKDHALAILEAANLLGGGHSVNRDLGHRVGAGSEVKSRVGGDHGDLAVGGYGRDLLVK